MGIVKKKITEDVLVEVDKSYDTKNLQGMFLVKRIATNKQGEQMTAWGDYLKDNLTNCPIGIDRLIVEKKIIGEKNVCDKCLHPIDEKYDKKI